MMPKMKTTVEKLKETLYTIDFEKRHISSMELKRYGKWITSAMFAVAICLLLSHGNVYASQSTSKITSAFDSIYSIIAAIVSSIGELYLLWGVFEWATALNSQDPGSQSMAFKRISAGLVACLAPQIINMIAI